MNHLIHHDCKKELREANLKVTPARLGILSILENTNTPLDVVSLIGYLSEKNIKADRVTVFRIINTLLGKGIVKPIQFNDGKLRYEHRLKSDHHHFVCEKCNSVEDISECILGSFEKKLNREKKLLIKHHSLEFFGLCTKCQ